MPGTWWVGDASEPPIRSPKAKVPGTWWVGDASEPPIRSPKAKVPGTWWVGDASEPPIRSPKAKVPGTWWVGDASELPIRSRRSRVAGTCPVGDTARGYAGGVGVLVRVVVSRGAGTAGRGLPRNTPHEATRGEHANEHASTPTRARTTHHAPCSLSGAALTYGDRRSRACSARQGSTGALDPRCQVCPRVSPRGEGSGVRGSSGLQGPTASSASCSSWMKYHWAGWAWTRRSRLP